MAALRAPERRAPLTTAAVLFAVAIALGIVLFVVAYPARSDHRKTGVQIFSATEQAAMSAASTVSINILSYSRATFAADYQRALDGTSGQLRSDMDKERTPTLNQMTSGKFDLKATVSDVGLEGGTAGAGYQVLVVVSGYKVDDTGKASASVVNRLELTMVNVGGKWLASNLKSIALT